MLSLKKRKSLLYLAMISLGVVGAFGCLNQDTHAYGFEGPYADFGYGAGYEGPYADSAYSEQPMVDWGRIRRNQGFLGASPGKTGPPDSARENRTRAVQAISRDMRLKNPAPSKPLNSREEIESLRTEVRYRRNHPRSSNSRTSR